MLPPRRMLRSPLLFLSLYTCHAQTEIPPLSRIFFFYGTLKMNLFSDFRRAKPFFHIRLRFANFNGVSCVLVFVRTDSFQSDK